MRYGGSHLEARSRSATPHGMRLKVAVFILTPTELVLGLGLWRRGSRFEESIGGT